LEEPIGRKDNLLYLKRAQEVRAFIADLSEKAEHAKNPKVRKMAHDCLRELAYRWNQRKENGDKK
jgi:hypothetical protein